ncbi:MAG: ADP-ribosylglycohydrolase family protein [Terrimicrobiaceae bacterium]
MNLTELPTTTLPPSPGTDLHDRLAGFAFGSFVGDALAMPVHWYYDRAAMQADYGVVEDFLAPRNPHPGSILWRSQYTALNERGNILHDQAVHWGNPGVHYHQFLQAGENTLNLQLTKQLLGSLIANRNYNADDFLERYIHFFLTPGQHRDTYVEECHRKFFTAHARGMAPRKCAGSDIHIGGLTAVGALIAFFGEDTAACREAVQEHIKLTHRSPEVLSAADAMVRIAGLVLEGADLREVIPDQAPEWFSKRKAEKWLREPDAVVIGQRLSPACYINDAFPACLYLAWKYADDFESGVIANTNVGGDNCHRGAVVGSLLGGASGLARIPSRFQKGIHDAGRLSSQIHQLVKARLNPRESL